MKKLFFVLVFLGGLFFWITGNEVQAFTGPPSGCTPSTCTNGPLTELFPKNIRAGTVIAGVVGSFMDSPVYSITGGGYHTCAVLSTGETKCWGHNQYGQLGNNSVINSSIPVSVSNITNAVEVSAGDYHTCILLADGTAKCFGSGGHGRLGNGGTANSSVPVLVSNITSAVQIVSGGGHSCVLNNASGVRSVQCWGYNEYGQLGNNSVTNSSVPVSVSLPSSVVSIGAGYGHTCALLSDGTIQCWGYGGYGQLGNGGTANSSVPTPVSNITNAVGVFVGGYSTCAILSDHTMKCWGFGYYGEMGNGVSGTYNYNTPVSVSSITNAVYAAVGDHHSCAVLSDGTAKCWGRNVSGRLGNGTTTNSAVPVSVSHLVDATLIAVGGAVNTNGHSCAISSEGVIKCWGDSAYGQLGDSTLTSKSIPVRVTGIQECPPMIAEGITYPTLEIAGQCWTTVNMRHVPVSGTYTCYNEGSTVSAPYDDTCALYGRLYYFNAALAVCPEGWRLPSLNEASVLLSAYSTSTSLINAGWFNGLYPGIKYGGGGNHHDRGTTFALFANNNGSHAGYSCASSGTCSSGASLLVDNGLSIRCIKN
jgi:uncharacterized protein (TIGR02145 family)